MAVLAKAPNTPEANSLPAPVTMIFFADMNYLIKKG
jgi:hypothetical protein